MSTIYPQSRFPNAQNAFVMLFDQVKRFGTEQDKGVRSFPNVSFYIENPLENTINVQWRDWSKTEDPPENHKVNKMEASDVSEMVRLVKVQKGSGSSTMIWMSLEEDNTDRPTGVGMSIIDDRLCLNVYALSLDLWSEFCVGQYYYSELLKYIAKKAKLETGWCHYSAGRLDLEEDKCSADTDFYKNLKER